MRPSHVNWQKICRLDRYPHCPGGKHGEGGLRRVHPRWSGTRGPHGEGEGEDFPWLPRTSRSGRKQKQWETGLTCRERSPRYGATLEPGDVPPDCEEARGGGVRVGFGARRAPTHPVAGGTDDPELSSETFFFLFQGMWEARFQPGWIWFLRICANRKRGRKPDDESCLSKLHCGSGYCRVRFQPWALHGAIQYSKCRPQWRKKKLWLKHVLLPWVVYYCGCRFSSRDASPISMFYSKRPCHRGSGTWILCVRRAVKCQTQRPRQASIRCHQNVKELSILCNLIFSLTISACRPPRCPCTIAGY